MSRSWPSFSRMPITCISVLWSPSRKLLFVSFSELIHFRRRICEADIEMIQNESIRVNLLIDGQKKSEEDRDKDRVGGSPTRNRRLSSITPSRRRT